MSCCVIVIGIISIFVWLYFVKVRFSQLYKTKKEQFQKLLIGLEQLLILKDKKNKQLQMLLACLEQLSMLRDKKKEELHKILNNNKIFKGEEEYLAKKENFNEIEVILDTIISNKSEMITSIVKQIEDENIGKTMRSNEYSLELEKLQLLREQLYNILQNNEIKSEKKYLLKKENLGELKIVLQKIISDKNQLIKDIEKKIESDKKELKDLVTRLTGITNKIEKEGRYINPEKYLINPDGVTPAYFGYGRSDVYVVGNGAKGYEKNPDDES